MTSTGLARKRVPELMDDESIAPEVHRAALGGLRVVNQLSLTARELLPYVLGLAHELGKHRLRLLDVACGGGDVPLELARLCARHGMQLDLVLADRSETALAQAHVVAAQARFSLSRERNDAAEQDEASRAATTCAATCLQCDVLSDALPEADIITNSLFLHHLDPEPVTKVLSHFASRARHLLLVSDLRRSRMGLAVAWTACHFMSRSPVVHHDGPASVRAAYTIEEMRELAANAGLVDMDIRRCWPWRMLLCWRRRA